MDSQIEIAILISNLNVDFSFHPELNLSSIDPPSNRIQMIHGVFEFQNQNLYGSELTLIVFMRGET